jgi:hypothetical protein
VNASGQVKENEEGHVAFEQKLHLSEDSPSSASTKIPPDKVANEQVSQASSCEPPGIEMPSALLCNGAACQPKVKPCHTDTTTTLESEGIAKGPSIPIQGDAAVNQPRSLFNVKPPPYSQPSHEAEIEFNESATKSSASVEIQRREYGPISKDSEFVHPGNELLQTKVAAEENDNAITDREPFQIEKCPNCAPEAQAGCLGSSPALLTTEVWSTLDQHNMLNGHGLFGPIEATTEFSPVPFSSSAGDNGFLPQEVYTSIGSSRIIVVENTLRRHYQLLHDIVPFCPVN